MTKYLLEIDADRWRAFKITALQRGLKIKDAIIEAIDLYIKTNMEKLKEQPIKIQIIKAEAQRNLQNVIDEYEIKRLVRQLIERKKKKRNKGYDGYAIELRNKLFDKLKKGVILTESLAEELRAFVKAYKDELPKELSQAISQITQIS